MHKPFLNMLLFVHFFDVVNGLYTSWCSQLIFLYRFLKLDRYNSIGDRSRASASNYSFLVFPLGKTASSAHCCPALQAEWSSLSSAIPAETDLTDIELVAIGWFVDFIPFLDGFSFIPFLVMEAVFSRESEPTVARIDFASVEFPAGTAGHSLKGGWINILKTRPGIVVIPILIQESKELTFFAFRWKFRKWLGLRRCEILDARVDEPIPILESR